MTAFAIVTGSLFKAPEQRTSKTGRPYVTATIRTKDGEASQWWRVTVFSESAQAELMRLGEGDACSVQGSFKAELYPPEGTPPKVSLSIIAPSKPRKGRCAGRPGDPSVGSCARAAPAAKGTETSAQGTQGYALPRGRRRAFR
jgi:single-stranded DNA-binding protein